MGGEGTEDKNAADVFWRVGNTRPRTDETNSLPLGRETGRPKRDVSSLITAVTVSLGTTRQSTVIPRPLL